MEVTFGKTAPTIDVASEVTNTQETTVPPTPESPAGSQVPATLDGGGAGDFAGDYLPGFKDVILPRLNIVQSIGTLKDEFPQGAIVYGQNLVLFTLPIIDRATGNVKVPASAPVEITIMGWRPTRYAEKIAGGERGMLVNSEAEVRAAGGTLDYKEWDLKKASGMKRFEVLAEAFVLIKRPPSIADDDSTFIFPAGNDKYAVGLWAIKGAAYTQACKKTFFVHRKMGCLAKGGYPSWSYNLSTRSETNKGNTYYVPVCVPNAPTTPVVMEFIKSALRPQAATDPADDHE